MDCEEFDQVVMDLLYGEADEEPSAEAKRHAEGCERCASTLRDLRATRKSAAMPLVEPPDGFEQQILEAAKQAQQQIPWPRRIGRWVSWAGGYAMRPQLAMAALLLLMIGSSLLLIRGRPGSEQVGFVRVTEQGVPEREGADQEDLTANPSQLPPRSATEAAGRQKAASGAARPRGRRDDDVTARGTKAETDTSRKEDRLAKGSADAGFFLDDEVASPTGSRAGGQQLNTIQGPGGPASAAPPPDGYAQAMEMYRAGDYANAYRAFDMIVMQGGANAPSAALYAAKSVRSSSGCTNALPRFESVVARFGKTGAGMEAKWETATCARIVGDYTRARILYRELAQVESQRERAERELARISTRGQSRAAKAPASAEQDQPAAADPKQEEKEESPPRSNAY